MLNKTLRFIGFFSLLFASSVSLKAQCSARFSRIPDTLKTVYFFEMNFADHSNFNEFIEESWDFGDGTSKTYSSKNVRIKHTYAATGWYKVTKTLKVENTAGNILCLDSFSQDIYVGGLIGTDCNAGIQAADTVMDHGIMVTDSSANFNTAQPTKQIRYVSFGGYEYPTWLEGPGQLATNFSNMGDGLGFIAPNSGWNKACVAKQYLSASDSIISECLACKDVYVSSPFSLSATNLSQVDPLTGEVNLQMQGSANPQLGNNQSETFIWYFPSGNRYITGNNQSIRLPRPGTYYYRRSYGVLDLSASKVIARLSAIDSVVIPQANTCQADFDWQEQPLPTNNLTFQFNNRSSNLFGSSSSSSFLWTFGDGDTSTSESPSKSFNLPGAYTVKLIHTVKDSSANTVLCSDTITKTLYLNPNGNACLASFQVLRASSTNFNIDVANRSIPQATDSNYTINYNWDFGDGQTSTAAYPQHSYASNGAYLLCLNIAVTDIRNSATCSSSYCDTIGLDSLGNLMFKTNQGFTLNVIDPATISKVERKFVSTPWEVYPNPAIDRVKIANLDYTRAEVQVVLLDLQGRIVLEKTLLQEADIALKSLKPGMYLLQIKQAGETAFRRILIE